jgi:Family of unknown function (DUF5994)
MLTVFTKTIPRHTVSVTTAGGREPIALLVVPPSTPAGAARAAMNTAATGPGTAQAADILTAEEARGGGSEDGRGLNDQGLLRLTREFGLW